MTNVPACSQEVRLQKLSTTEGHCTKGRSQKNSTRLSVGLNELPGTSLSRILERTASNSSWNDSFGNTSNVSLSWDCEDDHLTLVETSMWTVRSKGTKVGTAHTSSKEQELYSRARIGYAEKHRSFADPIDDLDASVCSTSTSFSYRPRISLAHPVDDLDASASSSNSSCGYRPKESVGALQEEVLSSIDIEEDKSDHEPLASTKEQSLRSLLKTEAKACVPRFHRNVVYCQNKAQAGAHVVTTTLEHELLEEFSRAVDGLQDRAESWAENVGAMVHKFL